MLITVMNAFGPGKTYRGLDELFAVSADEDRWMMPYAKRLSCDRLGANAFTCSQNTLSGFGL